MNTIIMNLLRWVKVPDFDFNVLFHSLDCQRDLYGVGVIYNDGEHSYMVRAPAQGISSQPNKVTHVIITNLSYKQPDYIIKSLEDAATSALKEKEIVSTLLSCGAVVLWIIGTAAAGSATVATFGTATPLAIVSTMGTVATGLQCANGLLRLKDIYLNDGKRIKWYDSQDWYNATITTLDLIAIAGAGAGRDLYVTIKVYRAFKKASSLAALSMKKWLSKLTEKERVNISRAIIKYFNPAASEKQISMWLTANKYPKMIDTEQAILELNEQLNNVIMACMGFGGSAFNGMLRNPGSITQASKYAIGVLRTAMVIQ